MYDPSRRAFLAKGAVATAGVLVDTQSPFAIILGCSDSRVSPEIVFDQGIGDLFVVRVAGNTAMDPILLGSIEYSVEELGSVLVMVLGHENCGAVEATLAKVQKGTSFPGDIGTLLDPVVPAAQIGRASCRERG